MIHSRTGSYTTVSIGRFPAAIAAIQVRTSFAPTPAGPMSTAVSRSRLAASAAIRRRNASSQPGLILSMAAARPASFMASRSASDSPAADETSDGGECESPPEPTNSTRWSR
ncbi:MAG: hypothetical protein QOH87_693 [Trebonia sp.]|nr:hypothetical protein [Trebonia sp.]